MTEAEREKEAYSRQSEGGRSETTRKPYKHRCVTMYGGRVMEKGRQWKREGVAGEGKDGDKGLK